MGKRWRVFSEAFRQKVQTNGKFPTTSNERNAKMLHEAEAFARCLRQVRSQLGRVERESQGLASSVKRLLESQQPRPYIIAENGEIIPEVAEVEIVGSGVQVERITTSAQVMALRLKEEVHAPLQEWLGAYNHARSLVRSLEMLRLELDSRKRTVITLEGKAKSSKTRIGKDGNQERAFLDIEKKLRHKEEKCNACRNEFDQQELECSTALRTLLKDSANLRDFMAQAYKVLYETSLDAYGGFSPSHPTSPSPYVPSHANLVNPKQAHSSPRSTSAHSVSPTTYSVSPTAPPPPGGAWQ